MAYALGTDLDTTQRLTHVGWVTLGRFIDTPQSSTVTYIQNNLATDFGTITATPSLHISNNRLTLGHWSNRA